MFGSGVTTLIISNEEMNDFMKVVQSLEKSGENVSKTIKNKAKKQKEGKQLELARILIPPHPLTNFEI